MKNWDSNIREYKGLIGKIRFAVVVVLIGLLTPVFASHNSNKNARQQNSSSSLENSISEKKRATKKSKSKSRSTSRSRSKKKSKKKVSSKSEDKLEAERRRKLSIELLQRIGQSPTRGKPSSVKKARPLTLHLAEELALQNDPLIARIRALQESMEQRALAAHSWPDPKLKMGFVNLPYTSRDFNEVNVTQLVIGLKQEFPPFGAVTAKRDQFMALSEAQNYQYKNRELEILRQIRRTWLTVHKFFQIRKLVNESLEIFTQLKTITRLQYRSGRGKQQDVLRAQLEESLLLDKKVLVVTQYEKAVAKLRSALNITLFKRNLEMAYPEINVPPPEVQIRKNLDRHPWYLVGESHISAAKNGVQFANAQFFPGWSLDLSYGQRGTAPDGTERDNLISAMVMVDLPIFWGGRQSRQLQSSQLALSAAKYQLDDRLREIKRRLEVSLSAYARASERLELYKTQLLPQAEQNTESSLSAYQSGVNTFSVLVRARLSEMNSRIQFIKINVDKAFAKVELLYLAGVR